MEKLLQQARWKIQSAKSLTFLTGAGVSAESGIPTFRDKGGIWEKFDPTEVATPEAFARNPRFVWEWYAARMKDFQHAQPNAAHQVIARLEQEIPHCCLITQNIDNLHRAAGSKNIVEIHGNVWRTRCLECGEKAPLKEIPQLVPPLCSSCRGMLRPDVVWFGEELDAMEVARAEVACHAEVFMVVGTSGEVWPAAGFAHRAKSLGAYVIEVNTQATELSDIADLSLLGRAGEILTFLGR